MRAAVARRPGLAAAVVVAVAAVVFLAPALFSGKVFAGDDTALVEAPQQSSAPADFGGLTNTFTFDSTYVFHPDFLEARRQVRSGELPAWTSHIGTGRSLLASQQSAPLYPANVLGYAMDFWTSLEWSALLKLLAAGLGMAWLLRTLGRSWPASALGGVAFMLSTHLATWMAHPHSNVYVLGPLMAVFAVRAARSGRLLDGAGLAAAVGVALLGGHPPSALAVGVWMVAPLAVAFLVREPGAGLRPPRQVAGRLALLAGAVVVGVLAAAVMVLPFAEALGVSTGNADRGRIGLERSALNTLVFPELWGNPMKFELPGGPHVFQERVLYFGAIPLLLAIGGLVARRPSQGQVAFVVCGLAAAVPTFVPSVAEIVLGIPGFSSSTLRLHIAIAFAGTGLAAYGVDTMLSGSRAERLRLAGAVAVVGLLVPLQWLVRHTEVYDRLGDALRHIPALDEGVQDGDAVRLGEVLSFALYAGLAAAAAALAVVRRGWGVALVGVLVAAIVVDSTAVGRYIPIQDRDRVDVAPGATLRFFQERGAAGERVAGDLNVFGPNLAHRWPSNDPRVHNLPTVDRYQRLWLGLGGIGEGSNQQQQLFARARDVPDLLDVVSARWILSFDLEQDTPADFRRVRRQLEWPVFENRDAHPRARFVARWETAADADEALARVKSAGARVLRDVPVIEGVAPRPRGGSAAPAAVPVRLTRDEDTEVRLEVDAPEDGHLVLNDVHYPGWKAEVDGREAEIRPANVAFRAVAVPRGRHVVTFRYESAAVRWGVIVSVAVWLALAALALVALLRRRRARSV